MPETDLEFKIEYPRFTGRNYVVAVYDNPHNKPQWDPTNFFIARFLLTKKRDLEKILGRWLTERPSLVTKLEEEGKSPVFDLDREYKLDLEGITQESTMQLELDFEGEKRDKRKLTELTAEQLFDAVRERIKKRFGSYKVMDLDYRQFFFFGNPTKKTHSGPIVLTAYMRSKGDGRKGSRYHRIGIKGPFENSETPFALLSCSCEDSSAAKIKGGYTPNQLGCIETAATLLLARYHPETIKNLEAVIKRNRSRVRLPFHVHEGSPSDEEVQYAFYGKQPNLVNLMVDTVFAYIFNRQTKYEISKALTKLPVIYDSDYTRPKLEEGRAGFEVIPNKYIFDESNPIPPAVREWFNRMKSYYERNGFQLNRFVIENKDSDYESIAMEYVKRNEKRGLTEVRRLILGDGPPIEKKMVFSDETEPDIFFMERHPPKYVNPYAQLFKPHYDKGIKPEDFDDASRTMPVFSEYRIPWFIGIQDEDLVQDYRTAIEAYFEGGYYKFTRWLHVRNRFLGESEYKEEMMNVPFFLKDLSPRQ